MLSPRVRIVALTVIVIGTLTAADGADFDVRYLLATVGLFFLGTVFHKLTTIEKSQQLSERTTVEWRGRVDAALWGVEGADGKRVAEWGVVHSLSEVAKQLPEVVRMTGEAAANSERALRAAQDATAQAATAADAARTAQLMVREHDRYMRERGFGA